MSLDTTKIEVALNEVRNETVTAYTKHPDMVSPHEGWAILREEVDELWDEVKVKQSKHDRAKMRREAKQVAAMAIRFMVDLT